MNTQYINSINLLDREIQNIERKINDLDSKINNKQKDATRLLERINREKNLNSLIGLQKQLQRLNEETSRIEKDKIAVSKSLNDKRKRKGDLQQKVSKEEEKERKKSKNELKEQLGIQERITREMERQRSLSLSSIQEFKASDLIINDNIKYDVFISHASEDKVDFVKPLATTLIELGLKVWYDEFELRLGDSLRRSIDKGLINSKYGIVVLSPSFFAKQWTQYELDGLVAKEMNGVKVILPLWHRVTKNDVLSYSPTLSDKKALNTTDFTIEEIAKEIASLFE